MPARAATRPSTGPVFDLAGPIFSGEELVEVSGDISDERRFRGRMATNCSTWWFFNHLLFRSTWPRIGLHDLAVSG